MKILSKIPSIEELEEMFKTEECISSKLDSMIAQESEKSSKKSQEKSKMNNDALIKEAVFQLQRAMRGYDIEFETVTTESFDAQGNLTGSKVQTKSKHIYIDPKDALSILSRLSPEFQPGYAKDKLSAEDDLSLEQYI